MTLKRATRKTHRGPGKAKRSFGKLALTPVDLTRCKPGGGDGYCPEALDDLLEKATDRSILDQPMHGALRVSSPKH